MSWTVALSKMSGVGSLAVAELRDYLPHRVPAIWVDEVTRYGEAGGECRILLSPEAPYVDAGIVRPTSYVEWVAQAFGYAIAAWHRQHGTPPLIQRAYLVSVSQLQLTDLGRELPARSTPACLARAVRTHQMGPISVVSGEVLTQAEAPLCSMRLKIFGQ